MKKNYYILCLLFSQFVWSQQVQDLVGNWKGWYKEGLKNFDIQLDITRFDGTFYEGELTLKFDTKDATFTTEGKLDKNGTFQLSEKDLVRQHAPDYVKRPQWCKADYKFIFSDLGERFRLRGIAKVPKENIAYIDGRKVYNSPKCNYFDPSEIELYRNKNPDKDQKKVDYPHAPTIDKTANRENITTKVIEAEQRVARVTVWDDKQADGDIVSIFHNGKLVKEKIKLLKAHQRLSIPLVRGKNVIAMYSISMGKTPPNSAAMKIEAGNRTYNIRLTSDTRRNGSVVIYYYPKK